MKLEELNAEQFKELIRKHMSKINSALSDNDPYDVVVAYKNAANDGIIGYLPISYHSRWSTMINDSALVNENGKWVLGNMSEFM